MSILSEQERDGLEDVFLSISSTRFSPLKWSLSQYHCYWILHIKESMKYFLNDCSSIKKTKSALKWSILPTNYKKIEKHR
ncbi:MAG: hypothetical protein Q8M39_07150 [Sulfuricurvum sp.]|nr:hypothetical protein [Sulfuricurvum sp.]